MKHAIDLTRGNILAVLTKLAMPIMATSLIQMAYNLTDMIWIGRLGASAVAAVGSAGMFMWLASGFTTIARTGGQVMTGQMLGAKEQARASMYAQNALQFGIVFALLIRWYSRCLPNRSSISTNLMKLLLYGTRSFICKL